METRPKKTQHKDQAATLFIFDKKTPKESKIFLKEIAKKIKNPSDLQKLWLIRDSTSGNFLTVDFILYSKKDNVWLGYEDKGYGMTVDDDGIFTLFIRTSCDGNDTARYIIEPTRYTLTANGWKVVRGNDVEESKKLIKAGVNTGADSATSDDVNGLLALLNSEGFEIENRVVPSKKSEETQKKDYGHYQITHVPNQKIDIIAIQPNVKIPEKIITGRSLSLNVKMASQLVCAFQLEMLPYNDNAILDIPLMKNPVVLKENGKSYDRENLISKGYTEKDFYPNLHLKNIIDIYLSNRSEADKRKLIEEEFKCPLGYSTMWSYPMISPSGKTYDSKNISDYLNGGNLKLFDKNASKPDPFNRTINVMHNDLIHNINLEVFINKFMKEYRNDYKVDQSAF
jgi:hypothetical protein